MFVHPQFDPVAFSLGPVSVRWYGLAYLAGFALFWLLGRVRCREAWRSLQVSELEDLLFYGVLAIVLGGRLGFCLFYQPGWYLSHPLDVLKVWQGGMSAHGGMIGGVVAMALFAWARGKSFLALSDFVVPLVPLGLFFGRLGNFVNGELWGRVCSASIPWSMVFPQSGSFFARHPSQLYEAFLEGLVLFVVLWIYSKKQRMAGNVSALFCLGYALARLVVECFREPDAYLGFGLWGLTRGQWLTVPLLLLGLGLFAANAWRCHQRGV